MTADVATGDGLAGCRVPVTGGSPDIGRAVCAAFAARGARVALVLLASPGAGLATGIIIDVDGTSYLRP